MTLSTVTTPDVIDVRLIPPPQRHLRLFAAYESLPVRCCCARLDGQPG